MSKLGDAWKRFVGQATEEELEAMTAHMGNGGAVTPKDGGQATAAKVDTSPAAPAVPSAREVELAAKLVDSETARFVEGLQAAGKITPAEREKLAPAFAQAMRDDLAHPVASGQPTRAALLAAPYEARPKSAMREEMLVDVPPGSKGVDPSDKGALPGKGTAQEQMAEGAEGVGEWAAMTGPIKVGANGKA